MSNCSVFAVYVHYVGYVSVACTGFVVPYMSNRDSFGMSYAEWRLLLNYFRKLHTCI